MTTSGAPENSTEAAGDSAGLVALLAAPDVALSVIPMPRIGADPPTEFRPFVYGNNPTTKGMLKLTREGAKQAVALFEQRGVAKCFDLWHSTYKSELRPQDRFAVGHFKIEDRDDGVWFTNIQWVPQYAAEIREGKWPFISPAAMHSKDGVITGFGNAALVTDPATIGAQPTILSDSPVSEPPQVILMSDDDKRVVCDAYAGLEGAFRRCQAMADTAGATKELANDLIGLMTPVMDKARGYMQSAGYLAEGAAADKAMAAGEKMLAQLAADFGEPDPERLHGKLHARLDEQAKPAPLPEGAQLLSKEDAAAVSKLMLEGHANKVPTVKRETVAAMPLTGQVAYLSAATEITPSAAPPREAPPLAPTVENTKAALKEDAAEHPTGANTMATEKTLATLDAGEKKQLEGFLDACKQMQGEKFDEAKETSAFLSLLSDYEAPQGDQIRQLPVDDAGHITTLAGGGR